MADLAAERAGAALHRHPRHQPGELLPSVLRRLPVRAALSRPPQEDERTRRLPPSKPPCQSPYQACPKDLRCLDRQGVGEHSAHHGVSCAKGRDSGNCRAQAEFLRPTKPDQESPLGVGQHPTDHLHPRVHRRSHPEAVRTESAQSRRVLSGVTTPNVKNRTFRTVAKTYRHPKAERNTFMQHEMRAFLKLEDRCNNLRLRNSK